MEQYNESVNSFMKPLLNDEYLFPIISLIVAIYAALARPKTPKFLYNLFQNPLFRLVAISYIAYRSTKNFQSALLIAAAFLSIMHLINKGSLNFLADSFTNSSNTTADFTEYFNQDATPVHDEPILDFAYDDNSLLAERFGDMEGDLNEEERFGDESDLNEEERFGDDGTYMEEERSDLNEEERFGDESDLNEEERSDLNEEERFGDESDLNEEERSDLNEEERFGDESDLNEEERFGDSKPTSKVVATTAVVKKEKNSDMLEGAPSGSYGASDFASF